MPSWVVVSLGLFGPELADSRDVESINNKFQPYYSMTFHTPQSTKFLDVIHLTRD